MKKTLARSRRHLKLSLKQRIILKWKMSRIRPLIILPLVVILFFTLFSIAHAQVYAPTLRAEDTEPIVQIKEVIKEVEVDRTFTTEKQQILAYLIEKFGNDSDKAIIMIGTCENSTFAPDRKSPLNIQKSGRRSYDIGVMQINVDETNIEEQKRLTNWKYNIDRGYQKYHAAGKKFTAWTCASKIGQKNYLGQ